MRRSSVRFRQAARRGTGAGCVRRPSRVPGPRRTSPNAGTSVGYVPGSGRRSVVSGPRDGPIRDRHSSVAVARGGVVPETKRERQHPIRVALSNDYELALLGLAQMLAQHPREVQIVDLTTLPKMPHDADIILYDTFGRLPDEDPKLSKIVGENDARVVVYSWDDY